LGESESLCSFMQANRWHYPISSTIKAMVAKFPKDLNKKGIMSTMSRPPQPPGAWPDWYDPGDEGEDFDEDSEEFRTAVVPHASIITTTKIWKV